MAMGVIRHSITRSLRLESKVSGIDRKERLALLEAAVINLKQKQRFDGHDCGPSQYLDEFTGCVEEVMHEVPLALGANPTTPSSHPTRPSVDAVFPRMPSKVFPSRYFVHAEGNVAVTSAVLQYAKYTYLPGSLAIISDYLKLDNQHRTVEARVKLFHDLRPFHILTYKHSLHKSARTTGEVVQAEFDQQQAQYISGKLIPGQDDHLTAKASRVCRNAIATRASLQIWDVPTTSRLASICSEMHLRYKENFRSASDGAPWISLVDMPVDWSWNSWATICTERLARMRIFCNRRHEMKDNAETLFLEWMYQHCTDDPQYGDGLDLPLVPWVGHPLRTSVAHKHHGRGMASGWKEHPEHLSDRIDEDNNMLFESWFWNIAKQDMHEGYYTKAAEVLRKVNMPKAYFDPDMSLPEHLLPESATPLDDKDVVIFDVPGQGFDEDALGGDEEDQGATSGTGKAVAAKSTTRPDDVDDEMLDIADEGFDGDAQKGGKKAQGATSGTGEAAITKSDWIGADEPSLQGRLRVLRKEMLTDKDFQDKFINDKRVCRLMADAQTQADAGDEAAGKQTYNDLLEILNVGRED